MKNSLSVALCLMLIGCAHAPVIKPFVEPLYGMTRLQMTNLLGTPDSIEIYKKEDQSRMEFYMYHQSYGSSQTKIPVGLINNKVVGWGETFYEDHVSQDDTRIK